MVRMKDLTKEQREGYYQSKYDYFKVFNRSLVIITTLAYLSFMITDCLIFGRFSYETALSRFIVIIPAVLFLVLEHKVSSYKIMVPATYLMIHIIIWCTDWSTYLLPDRTYAVAGMIVMNLVFVCAGFAAPFKWSTFFHAILIVDILIAHIFIRYEDIDMMFVFNLPCILAVCYMNHVMQKAYLDQYITKESMHNMMVHDQLTGMYNRNKIKELADGPSGRLIFAKDIAVGLLLIDIDHFKKINDTYGHEVGDTVLKFIAGEVKGMLRNSDYVIRWGGEEFLVIVPGCGLVEARQLAERIRKKIESQKDEQKGVTISIGVAAYNGGNYNEDVKKADMALYEAKNNGRNRVCVYREK